MAFRRSPLTFLRGVQELPLNVFKGPHGRVCEGERISKFKTINEKQDFTFLRCFQKGRLREAICIRRRFKQSFR
jgi:hypothetical protein